MSARSDPPVSTTAQSARRGSWFITFMLVTILIGGAAVWRFKNDQSNLKTDTDMHLPRTQALVSQKIGSLTTYNQPVSEEELIDFYAQVVQGRQVEADVFTTLSRWVTDRLLPELWRDSQALESSATLITHQAMSTTIHRRFPQKLLVNGDVILYPDDRELRLVVSEPLQDFFRDTAWNWRWISFFLQGRSEDELPAMKELDIYAAEELSEFLSVLGVAVIQLADRHDGHSDQPIDAVAIDSLLSKLINRPISEKPKQTDPTPTFSAETKRQILDSMPRPMFREVTEQAKLTFVHKPNRTLWQRRADLTVPVGIAGGGVSSGDFDGDGLPDLYFAGDGGGRLYRNVDGARLEQVNAGLLQVGESRAGYFVDYDNDGDQDLFITFVAGSNRLYRNDGNGKFQDVTKQSGLTDKQGATTHEAVWFDMNNDGLLDVYTANFGDWLNGDVPTLGRINTNGGPNRLYRQKIDQGKRVFEEIGEEFGVDDRGWTHCVGAWDFDQDGYLDLFSLNDFGASLVYRNINGEGFAEVSREVHLDVTYNAMNFTLLDLDHSGHPAIYISQIMKLMHRQRYRKPTEQTEIEFSEENLKNLRALVMNRLYLRQSNDMGDGIFEDVHGQRFEPAELGWAWDASAFDYENDADLDLLILNGTESNIPTYPNEQRMKHIGGRAFVSQYSNERNVCYFSQDGFFYNVSERCPISYTGNSRGSCFFDFDGDGDLDVAINDYNAPARLFLNEQSTGNHWIRFHLDGVVSNRDAIGARVEIQFADQKRFDQVVSGSGFLSQNSRELHFGLGTAETVGRAIVIWPSGVRTELSDLESNRVHVVQEELP